MPASSLFVGLENRKCVKSVKKTCILYQLFMVFFCGFFMYNYKMKVLCHSCLCRNCTKQVWTKKAQGG